MIYVVAIILALCSSASADPRTRYALIVFTVDGSYWIGSPLYPSEAECMEAGSWASRYMCVPVEDTE